MEKVIGRYPVLWMAFAVFGTYTCMYAFRKPITATTFEEVYLWSVHYKVWLVTAQVFGYLISKLVGVKVISELKSNHRLPALLTCLSAAAVSLSLFGVFQGIGGLILLAINGFSLGFVWGILFSYIEGRRATDVLAVTLSITFIVASGWVKNVGRYIILRLGVEEQWMPILTGLAFTPLLIGCVLILSRIEPPNEKDRSARQPRVPLGKASRRSVFRAFAPGLTAVLLVNLLLTVIREIKDNYLVEIFLELGLDGKVSNYSATESVTGIVVLCGLGLLVLVKDNRRAFFWIHVLMFFGAVVMLLGTWAFTSGLISGLGWIILQGTGLYMTYTSFQSLYFERFIAAFGLKANVGFLIYTADFIGYSFSCVFLLVKEFADIQLSWSSVLSYASMYLGSAVAIATFIAWLYFKYQFHSSTYAKTD